MERIGQEERALPLPIISSPPPSLPPSSPALNVSGSRRRLATCLAGSSGQLWGRAGSIVGNSLLQVSGLPPQTTLMQFPGSLQH